MLIMRWGWGEQERAQGMYVGVYSTVVDQAIHMQMDAGLSPTSITNQEELI